MMLLTETKASVNGNTVVAASGVLPLGLWMPIAIMLIITAEKMEMKDAMDMNETFLRVLGKSKIKKITSPTTAQTTVQVALFVMVFRQIVQVKM